MAKNWKPRRPTGPTQHRGCYGRMVYLYGEDRVARDCACEDCGTAWELTEQGWRLVA